TPALPSSRLELVSLPAACVAGVGLWRVFYAVVFVHPGFQLRAIVVGAGGAGCTLVSLLNELSLDKKKNRHSIGYQVVGFIDDDEIRQGQTLAEVPVLGTRHDLVRLAMLHHVDEVVMAITFAESIHTELFEAILECRELGIGV